MSKNKLGPSCAKLKTARNNYSLDVSFESYAKNAIHLGMALLSKIKLAECEKTSWGQAVLGQLETSTH